MTLGRLHGSYGVCMDRMVFAWIVWSLHGSYGVCMYRMVFAWIVSQMCRTRREFKSRNNFAMHKSR
jgi:hypothetical protein